MGFGVSKTLEMAGVGYFTIGSVLKEGEDSFHSALNLADNVNRYISELRETRSRRGLFGNIRMGFQLKNLKGKLEQAGEVSNTSRMNLSLAADYLGDQSIELQALTEATGLGSSSVNLGDYKRQIEIVGNSDHAQIDLLQQGHHFGILYLKQMAMCMENLTEDCRTALRVQKRVSDSYVSTPRVLDELCQLHLAVIDNATQSYIPKGI